LKFIHAADIHIDSALAGLSAHEDAPVELLRTATRTAFSALIDQAIEEKVAFIIIAGDLYDTDWKEYNTGYFFIREMARLNAVGIIAIVLYGNHDAENDMTKKLTVPSNVRVFNSAKAHTIRLEELRVALHGQSFKQADTRDNLVPGYPDPIPGWLNIGVLHTNLQGTVHAPYAPCTLTELQNKGYAYWALGHVHQFGILAEAPWVVFPGNLQGRHVRETGPRGAVLVTYEDGQLQRPQRLLVDVVRWALANVDITGTQTREEVVAKVGQAFRHILDHEADGRPVACRVVLFGKSAAHGELFGQARQLRADLTAQAINVAGDNLWIEKIKVQSQPATDPIAIAERGDAVAELQDLLGEASQDPAFLASLKEELSPLLAKMPHDLFKQDVPALLAVKNGDFPALIAEIAPSVIDRIAREG